MGRLFPCWSQRSPRELTPPEYALLVLSMVLYSETAQTGTFVPITALTIYYEPKSMLNWR